MTEQELFNKIKESARQEPIPQALTPEQIAKRLKSTKIIRPVFHFQAKRSVHAAAVLLLCGALSAAAWGTEHHSAQKKAYTKEDYFAVDILPTETGGSSENDPESVPVTAGLTEQAKNPSDEPKKNAGTLYKTAKSYTEVYHVLQSSYEVESKYRAESDIADPEVSQEDSIEDGATAGEVLEDASAKKMEGAQNTIYSTTNLQTQGVDESDKIKTDGQYIYTVTGAKLKITDTAGTNLTPAGTIAPDLGASDYILEFYVDQNKLFLLVQRYDTSIQDTNYVTEGESGIIPLESCYKIHSLTSNAFTVLYTYDITDPANPSLAGTTKQDGYYYSSRKIGDIIYLFTQQGMDPGDLNGFVPCVNDVKIPCENIYISDEGREGFLISSVNVNEPDETVDKVMLVHNSVNIYVSEDAVYLYHSDVQSADPMTQIAKFSIKEGIINAVNATSVKGEIYDTFAINAYQDTLRVLTTFYGRQGSSDNHLYLLDGDLKLTGSLDGIAPGEDIYAARFFGNTAYFITYKNIDPLFAVDLTDTSNPVLLGELNVSGFSEYLHFWGKDRLLGIGYETDPESGENLGLKLVMFDISDPTELKVIDSLVLKDGMYSPALYQYKCVLADPAQNLIGFAAEYNPHSGDGYASYNVYSFTDGRFVPQLNEKLPDFQYISYDSVRGIYIGDIFFIVCPTEINSYKMTDGFDKLGHLDLTD